MDSMLRDVELCGYVSADWIRRSVSRVRGW